MNTSAEYATRTTLKADPTKIVSDLMQDGRQAIGSIFSSVGSSLGGGLNLFQSAGQACQRSFQDRARRRQERRDQESELGRLQGHYKERIKSSMLQCVQDDQTVQQGWENLLPPKSQAQFANLLQQINLDSSLLRSQLSLSEDDIRMQEARLKQTTSDSSSLPMGPSSLLCVGALAFQFGELALLYNTLIGFFADSLQAMVYTFGACLVLFWCSYLYLSAEDEGSQRRNLLYLLGVCFLLSFLRAMCSGDVRQGFFSVQGLEILLVTVLGLVILPVVALSAGAMLHKGWPPIWATFHKGSLIRALKKSEEQRHLLRNLLTRQVDRLHTEIGQLAARAAREELLGR